MTEHRHHRHPSGGGRVRTLRACIVASFVTTALVSIASCSDKGPPIVLGTYLVDGGQGFASTEDATTPSERTLVNYCASNRCPVGRTTCPGSRFACDIDLQTDRDNCGACGVKCPPATDRELFECVEGRCLLQCQRGAFDCDGVPDNGCEDDAKSNDNCGACGAKCTDPAKPCIKRGVAAGDMGCGCRGDDIICRSKCVNPWTDDQNCGACGNACPRLVDGGPPHPNMHIGCKDGACSQAKCDSSWANCDGNIENGCETNTLSPENCGSCGNSCGPGQTCGINVDTLMPECLCPQGQTFCGECTGGICAGRCRDLTADDQNCGRCGFDCTAVVGSAWEQYALGACRYGVCVEQCAEGHADCNGNTLDGCETNTYSDPMNCGDCGIICDAVAGQACVGGRCVVEPCDDIADAGGVPK